jgi:hypothetical protein
VNDAQLLDARRVLLQGIIDYTGLVPPAPLEVDEAVAAYRAARHHDHGWVLGRFVSPASRLEELAASLSATMVAGEEPWPISVVLDGELGRAAARAQSFAAHMGSAAEMVFAERRPFGEEAGEDRPSSAAAVLATARAMAAISPTVTVFIEAPAFHESPARLGDPAIRATGGRPNETLAAMAAAADAMQRTVGATISCGRGEMDAVPSVFQVTRFLIGCRNAGIPFTVTSGLEHAIRSHDSDRGPGMHGFVNVVVAAGLALDGFGEATIAEALSATDGAAFSIRRSGVAWAGHRLNIRSLQRLRHAWFPAFGSPSFDLPVERLIAVGALET